MSLRFALGLIAASALVVGMLACSESRANRKLERAQELARSGRYDEAITVLETMQRSHADTPAGRSAPQLITLYRGLRDAELKEDRRHAKDDLAALGRALFSYHERTRSYPRSLEELPGHESLPLVDPWGKEYSYRVSSNRRLYRLECLGQDGVHGGEGDDQDLRVQNGEFIADLPWSDR